MKTTTIAENLNIKQKTLLFFGAVVILFAMSLINGQIGYQKAFAGSEHNLVGYAWSDNIGWVSFNCTNNNSCSTANYGVNVAQNGDFSGYAWSDNIGWITFNQSELTGCPSGQCRAKMSGNGTVTGWVRALAGGGAQSGGWDGWISLSGSNPGYGVTFSSDSATGYSWGSDVVGWLDWSGGYDDNVPGSPPGGPPDGTPGGVTIGGGIPGAPIATITQPLVDDGNQDKVFGNTVVDVYTGVANAVNFYGEGTDYGGNPLSGASYNWYENNNCSGVNPDYSVQGFSKPYSAPGTYQMSFKVIDSQSIQSNCDSVTISATNPPAIPGACGTDAGVPTAIAPTNPGLCGDQNTLQGSVGGGNPWTWVCKGDNNGTTVNCSAPNSCGNNSCQPNLGETPTSCPSDCNPTFQEI